jgi:hypothetical protein
MVEPCGTCCIGPAFLIVGLLMIWGATQRYLLIQKIKNTATSKVRSVAVGLVELHGKAKCKEDLASPISKAKCIYWKIVGEYYHKSGKHHKWSVMFREEDRKQFYLQDDSGKMVIDPTGGEIDIPADLESTGHLIDKPEGGLLGILQKTPINPKILAYIRSDERIRQKFFSYSGYPIRVKESFIAENDPLFVLGTAETAAGASSAVAHENLIMKKGSDNILYISDTQESNVVDKLKWPMWIFLLLGLIVAGIGAVVLLI